MSEESLTEYTDRVIPSWAKNPEPGIDPGLANIVKYYIRRALELLDAVPRDDPFWAKTNKKATVYKADLWFWQVLEANPGDTEARWIKAALALAGCSESVIAFMAPLVAEYPPNLRWLVNATVWIWQASGADYTAALRYELSVLQNDPAVRLLLEGRAGNDELGRSIQVARSVLAGKSIFEAVEDLPGQ